MTNQRGFTLMELLLAIAIFAIVTTAALPSLTQFIQSNELTGRSNELITAMQFGRSESLKRGETVQVCASSDGAECGGDWGDGWMVAAFSDDGDVVPLRVWGGLGDKFETSSEGGSVEFIADGCADLNSNGNCFDDSDSTFFVELELPVGSETKKRRVEVEATGRAFSCDPDAEAGEPSYCGEDD